MTFRYLPLRTAILLFSSYASADISWILALDYGPHQANTVNITSYSPLTMYVSAPATMSATYVSGTCTSFSDTSLYYYDSAAGPLTGRANLDGVNYPITFASGTPPLTTVRYTNGSSMRRCHNTPPIPFAAGGTISFLTQVPAGYHNGYIDAINGTVSSQYPVPSRYSGNFGKHRIQFGFTIQPTCTFRSASGNGVASSSTMTHSHGAHISGQRSSTITSTLVYDCNIRPSASVSLVNNGGSLTAGVGTWSTINRQVANNAVGQIDLSISGSVGHPTYGSTSLAVQMSSSIYAKSPGSLSYFDVLMIRYN